MAIAFDNNSPDTSGGSVSSLEDATNWAVGGSNRVIVGFIWTSASTPTTHTGMKWGGSTGTPFTQRGSTLVISSFARLSLWTLLNPTVQSAKLYGNWAASQDECIIGAASYTGVDVAGTPFGNSGNPFTELQSPVSSGAWTHNVDVTGTAADDLVVGLIGVNLTGPGTCTLACPNHTERYEIESFLSFVSVNLCDEPGNGDTVSMEWNGNGSQSTDIGMFGLILKAAAGGGGGPALLGQALL